MGLQPKRHSPQAGSETAPEAGARLIPSLSTLPGHPAQAPTGWQPPPLGTQGQLDKAQPEHWGGGIALPGLAPLLGLCLEHLPLPPRRGARRGCLSQPHPQARPWEGQALSWAASSLPLRRLLRCQARRHLAGAQGSGQRWHCPIRGRWQRGRARRPLCGTGHLRAW